MSKRAIINISLVVLNVIALFFIYRSVKNDIDYSVQVREIDQSVIEKLKEIQQAQNAYKKTKGVYAGDFESLVNFFKYDKIIEIKREGDLDADSLAGLAIDTIYLDPMTEVFTKDYNIDNLPFVPPADTAKFLIQAGFIEKNDVKIPVYEVKDPYPFNKDRTLKIGSMKEAIYSGNWK